MPQNLTDLDIAEVSLVDRPANAEIDPLTGEKIPRARIALFKRDSVEKGAKYLVTEEDGTTHLPYTDESGKVNHHLLGAAWAALHGGYRGQKYQGPDKQKAIDRLKRIYEQEGLDTPATTHKGESMKTLEEIEKQLGEQATVIDAIKAENAVLKAENQLSPEERTFYQKLDADKRGEFLKCDTAKKKSMMSHEEPDGDEGAETMKKLDETTQELAATKARVTKAESDLAKTQTELANVLKRERTARFVAIAKADLSHTSGTDEAKADTLMKMADALGGEDSEAYKQAFGAMKKADEVLASQFVEKGTWGGGSDNPGAALEAKAQEISKRDKISVEKAYDKAMTENPDLYRRYREEWDRRHTVRQ